MVIFGMDAFVLSREHKRCQNKFQQIAQLVTFQQMSLFEPHGDLYMVLATNCCPSNHMPLVMAIEPVSPFLAIQGLSDDQKARQSQPFHTIEFVTKA
jgi:lactam utilization protein B